MSQKGQDVFKELLTLNQSLFEEEKYESAYHYLAAALHCTQALQKSEFAHTVENLALKQLKHIDRIAPHHKMSSKSAKGRNGQNFYRQLASLAAVEARIFESSERHKFSLNDESETDTPLR